MKSNFVSHCIHLGHWVENRENRKLHNLLTDSALVLTHSCSTVSLLFVLVRYLKSHDKLNEELCSESELSLTSGQ